MKEGLPVSSWIYSIPRMLAKSAKSGHQDDILFSREIDPNLNWVVWSVVNFQLLQNQPRSGQVQLDDGRVSLDSNSHFGPTERGV